MTTRYSSLLLKIQSGELAILDSGVSTELERRGQEMHMEVQVLNSRS
jgi:S-methylmethionine-dependent homocysteine/selenocysteine methylase